MEWSGDVNAHNATTDLKYNMKKSSHYNSLGNVNIGNVSIGLNTIPSGKYVYKNVSPIVDNGFSFYNSKKTIFN